MKKDIDANKSYFSLRHPRPSTSKNILEVSVIECESNKENDPSFLNQSELMNKTLIKPIQIINQH